MIDQLKYLEFFVSIHEEMGRDAHESKPSSERDSYFTEADGGIDCISLSDLCNQKQSILHSLSNDFIEEEALQRWIYGVSNFIEENSLEFNAEELKKRTIMDYVYQVV